MWVSLHDWCSVLECLTSGQRVVLAVSGRSKNKEPSAKFGRRPMEQSNDWITWIDVQNVMALSEAPA